MNRKVYILYNYIEEYIVWYYKTYDEAYVDFDELSKLEEWYEIIISHLLLDKELVNLECDLNEAYEYLYEYRSDYLEKDSINRIKNNSSEDDFKINVWKAIYDICSRWDNSREYETWFISWLKNIISLTK